MNESNAMQNMLKKKKIAKSQKTTFYTTPDRAGREYGMTLAEKSGKPLKTFEREPVLCRAGMCRLPARYLCSVPASCSSPGTTVGECGHVEVRLPGGLARGGGGQAAEQVGGWKTV